MNTPLRSRPSCISIAITPHVSAAGNREIRPVVVYLTLVLVAVFSFACPNNVAELLIDELVGLGIRIWSGGKAKRRNMS
jgi:hypothetical protein